ncbi:hypothetical protein [Maritimibacter fusiformis]|uniref:Arginine transporter n=1 Tax=Maritimibacter fusiformis TaxID=2603819 RepID=A0A5D0RG79_9RHOB|nr:hypothetical protein [Maritimibacter fusiformis]TYB80617.1 hypothetical protein FVF75_13370 [Maritimibacter fusiformis]
MKRTIAALALGMAMFSAAPAQAGGIIENACLGSDRPGRTRVLCNCIQQVADTVLSSSEQRRGAKFFKDPHETQVLRMSASRSDAAFWQKWQVFGATAEKYCQ